MFVWDEIFGTAGGIYIAKEEVGPALKVNFVSSFSYLFVSKHNTFSTPKNLASLLKV